MTSPGLQCGLIDISSFNLLSEDLLLLSKIFIALLSSCLLISIFTKAGNYLSCSSSTVSNACHQSFQRRGWFHIPFCFNYYEIIIIINYRRTLNNELMQLSIVVDIKSICHSLDLTCTKVSLSMAGNIQCQILIEKYAAIV